MSASDYAPNLSEAADELVNILTSQTMNYKVTHGEFFRVNFLDLCAEGIFDSCFGNNSSNPYYACAMDHSPEQSLKIPDYTKVAPHKYLSFHLGFNEAIVLVGKTPPEVKYFSYAVFLSSRFAEQEGETPENFRVIPIRNKPVKTKNKLAPREVIFSCLGEPLNNLKISTPGTPGGTPGCPFDQPVVIVVTANQDLQKEIYKSAIQAGFSSNSLNTVVIPQDVVKLGVTERDADTFSIGNRIAGSNKADLKLEAYLKDPGFKVLRVTAAENKGTPLPIPFLTPRGTGQTELAYTKPVEELRNKILEHYKNYTAVELITDIWLDESYIAIQQGVNNLGEARDTVYFGTGSFKLPEGAFAVVYGTNHSKTGKCTYSNIVVYGSKLDNGVCSVNNEEFENSASVYLESPAADDLYAWRFGFHKDSSDNYTQIPSDHQVINNDENTPDTYRINRDEDIYFGFRAYLEPVTKVGPVWNELILDRVIVFLPKK